MGGRSNLQGGFVSTKFTYTRHVHFLSPMQEYNGCNVNANVNANTGDSLLIRGDPLVATFSMLSLICVIVESISMMIFFDDFVEF